MDESFSQGRRANRLRASPVETQRTRSGAIVQIRGADGPLTSSAQPGLPPVGKLATRRGLTALLSTLVLTVVNLAIVAPAAQAMTYQQNTVNFSSLPRGSSDISAIANLVPVSTTYSLSEWLVTPGQDPQNQFGHTASFDG